jgi:hypothetical protein
MDKYLITVTGDCTSCGGRGSIFFEPCTDCYATGTVEHVMSLDDALRELGILDRLAALESQVRSLESALERQR